MVQPAVTFQDAADAMAQSIAAIFSRWTALLLTVDHQLGGDSQRIRDIQKGTVDRVLAARSIAYDDLVNFFYDEFDRMATDVEDESPEQVARHILQIRDALKNGDYGPAAQALQSASSSSSLAARSVTNSTPYADGESDGDDDDDDIDDSVSDEQMHPAQSEPVVDADGFTEVTRRGRHR